jgi:anti-sigma factor (TIGR02949 family)
MTCNDSVTLMEENLDGELDQQTASLLASHLATCPNCSREYRIREREREIYARYSRDVAVTPELWSAVQTQIEENLNTSHTSLWRRIRHRTLKLATIPRFSPALAASLILVAVGVTALVMKTTHPRPNETNRGIGHQVGKQQTGSSLQPPVPSSETTLAKESADLKTQPAQSQGTQVRKSKGGMESKSASSVKDAKVSHDKRRAPTAQQLVAQAEKTYLEAIATLSRDVKRPDNDLDPELRTRFEETLAVINRTIADTRQAVKQHPTDPEAVRYMLTAYAKKVEVLQVMASY